jgi:hypothetical protein
VTANRSVGGSNGDAVLRTLAAEFGKRAPFSNCRFARMASTVGNMPTLTAYFGHGRTDTCRPIT